MSSLTLTLGVRARLCCHRRPSSQHLAVFRDTTSVFLKSSPPVFSSLCLCNCSAAALCDLCAVTVLVCNIDCILIHYSAPPARRSKRAAAPAVTGQPGIHESVIILSFLCVSLPHLLCIYSFCLHLYCLFLCFTCRSLSLSTCHLSVCRRPSLTSTGCSHHCSPYSTSERNI